MRAAVACVAALAVLLAANTAPPPESLPLVLEHADHMEGARAEGEYVLTGNVRFRHGDLVFETQRALWQRDLNRVTGERGMRVTHRGSLLTADRGSYDRSSGRALAEGNVFLRDSSGEVEASGRRLDYDRVRRVAMLTGDPVVRRIHPERAGDSAGAGARSADTLSIRGERLRYHDSAGVAEAEGSVVITRRGLHVTSGRAEYRQRQDSLFLTLEPVARVDGSEVKGDVMRIVLSGEELRSLRVRGEAEALALEKATDSTGERLTRVLGDSLFLAFRDGAVDSVEVFDQARGSYWEAARPEYVNRMDGDYMVLRFHEGRAREADVLGSARSIYYHFERNALKGKNLAEGDTITLSFRAGKIEEVMVKGSASGVYQGRDFGFRPPADTAGSAADGR